MQVMYPACAGLDVHKRTVVACFLRTEASGVVHKEQRTFGTTTRELRELRAWLQGLGCTHAAMESTGDYWKPVYNLLEAAFELVVANARDCRGVPGRKTDVKDAEWLADLLRHGLLKASFIPPRPQRELRDYTRTRTTVVEERAAVLNRVQKLLEGGNIKLASVVTEIDGRSSRDMLAALVTGDRSPEEMAALARGRLQAKREALVAALEGQLSETQRYLLQLHLDQLDFLNGQIQQLDERISLHLREMDGPAPEGGSSGSATAAPAGNGPGEDGAPVSGRPEGTAATEGRRPRGVPPAQPLRYEAAVELLVTIPGFAARVSQNLLAEIGTNMHQFGRCAAMRTWVGTAPGNHQSGPKTWNVRARPGNRAAKRAAVQAAHGAIHTKGSYFKTMYHRIAARRGHRRAILAVANALVTVVFFILYYQEPYQELGGDYVDERLRQRRIKHHLAQLRDLGYEPQLLPLAA